MSVSFSVDFESISLHFTRGSERNYSKRRLSRYDLSRLLSNLGYEPIDYVPCEDPRVHGLRDLEYALSEMLLNVPSNSSVSIKRIGRSSNYLLTFK